MIENHATSHSPVAAAVSLGTLSKLHDLAAALRPFGEPLRRHMHIRKINHPRAPAACQNPDPANRLPVHCNLTESE